MSNPEKAKLAVVIAGPTASGKSCFAVQLAKRLNGEIVNADALQLYTDLQILSARPSATEQQGVAHHLFGTQDGAVAASAADWRAQALAIIHDIWQRGHLPIVVGGTGLYLRALLDGIAPIPTIPADIRAAVRALPSAERAQALAAEDPVMAARLDPHDSQRLARALEVVRATGRSLHSFHGPQPDGLAQSAHIVAARLLPDRALLYARCDDRLDQMVRDGAIDEVQALAGRHLRSDLPVMKAVGVPELLAHVQGKSDLPAALAAAKLSTRHYAKRQYTWFRNQCADWMANPTVNDLCAAISARLDESFQ